MKRVLCVDDDPTTRFIVRKFLGRVAPEVDLWEAEHGEDALRQLETSALSGKMPDLVLLDLNMPVMDGWSFLSRYGRGTGRPAERRPVIAVLTSAIQVEDLKDVQAHPLVSGCYQKPVTRQLLERLLAVGRAAG